jgi:hypothetical protein
MLTSKPGLGVAQRTSTPEAENEMAVVPPVNAKVRVVAVGSVDVVAAVVDVVWVVDDWFGAVWAGRDVVAGDEVWFVATVFDEPVFDEPVFDEPAVSWVATVEDVVSGGPSDSVVAVVVTVAETEATSRADGSSTTWSSTTDTPAHATPTAAALAASHIRNSRNFFMEPVSLVG